MVVIITHHGRYHQNLSLRGRQERLRLQQGAWCGGGQRGDACPSPARRNSSTSSVAIHLLSPIRSDLVRFGLVWLSVRAPIGRSCGGQEKRTASRGRTYACSAGVPPSADGLSPARMAKMRSSTMMRCTQQRTGAATGQKWSRTDRRCEESRRSNVWKGRGETRTHLAGPTNADPPAPCRAARRR
jgi:hypothetical protein